MQLALLGFAGHKFGCHEFTNCSQLSAFGKCHEFTNCFQFSLLVKIELSSFIFIRSVKIKSKNSSAGNDA